MFKLYVRLILFLYSKYVSMNIKSKKVGQYNALKKKYKSTNNDLQNTTYKLHEPH